jgi:PmbA protein
MMLTEILKQEQKEKAVQIQNSRTHAIRERNVVFKGARVFDNGKIGHASGMGEVNDSRLIESATVACKESGIAFKYPLPTPTQQIFDGRELAGSYCDPVGFAEALLNEVRTRHPNFNLTGSVESQDERRVLSTSAGTQLESVSNTFAIGFAFKHNDSRGIIDGLWEWRGNFADLDAAINGISEVLEAYEHPAPALTKDSYPIAFLNLNDPYLLSRKFRTDLTASTYFRGGSIFSGKMGEKVLSERFSLQDVSQDPRRGIYRPFDDEGVIRANDLTLIDHGRLSAVISDRRTASEFGCPLTGNGFRFQHSMFGAPSPTFKQFRVAPTARTLNEVVQGRDTIIASMPMGGDYTASGEFSSPIQLAFLMRDGKLMGRLPELSVSSHIEKMFGEKYVGTAAHGFSPVAPEIVVMEMDIRF